MDYGEAYVLFGYIFCALLIIITLLLMVKEWLKPSRGRLSDSDWKDDQSTV